MAVARSLVPPRLQVARMSVIVANAPRSSKQGTVGVGLLAMPAICEHPLTISSFLHPGFRLPPGLTATEPAFLAVDDRSKDTWKKDEVAFIQPAQEAQTPAQAPFSCVVPPLVRLAGKGDTKAVEQLLRQGEDPDSRDELGMTALHCAAKKGYTSIVALLIGYNASVDARAMSWKGEAPIHYAVKYGQAVVLEMLLKHGADPNIRTQDGKRPMDYASVHQQKSCTALLGKFTSQS